MTSGTAASPGRTDLALLVIRLGIGMSMLLFHGYGKISGGPERWTAIGSSMENLGITFLPVMWGLFAALAESAGSLLLALGVWFRPAAALLGITMIVAVTRHLSLPAEEPASGWQGASHALELLSVYVALFVSGSGRHTIRAAFRKMGN